MKRFNLILTVFAVFMVFSCATTDTVEKDSYGFKGISITPKNSGCNINLTGPSEILLVPGDYIINVALKMTGSFENYVFNFKINGQRPPQNLVKIAGDKIMVLTRVKDGEVLNFVTSISLKSEEKGQSRNFAVRGKSLDTIDVFNAEKGSVEVKVPSNYNNCQAPITISKNGKTISKLSVTNEGLKIKATLGCNDSFDVKYDDLDLSSVAKIDFKDGCKKAVVTAPKTPVASTTPKNTQGSSSETGKTETAAPKNPAPDVINLSHIWNTPGHFKRFDKCSGTLVFSSITEGISQECRFIITYDNGIRKDAHISSDGNSLTQTTEGGEGGCNITVSSCR